MSEGVCAWSGCGKPFTFERRSNTTLQIYCNQKCRLAAQSVRQAERRKAERAARPPQPRKVRPRKVSADRPRAERRSVLAVAVAEARRMVNEQTCPDCGGYLARDEALVFCRNRATARCDWMCLLTQRDRDPARDTDAPDPAVASDEEPETTNLDPSTEFHEETTTMSKTPDEKTTPKRRALTRDPAEVRRILLTALANGPGGPSELAAASGLGKSTVFGYLAKCCADGLVHKERGVYHLTGEGRDALLPTKAPAPSAPTKAPARKAQPVASATPARVAPAASEPAPVVEAEGLRQMAAEARRSVTRLVAHGLRALLARVEGP